MWSSWAEATPLKTDVYGKRFSFHLFSVNHHPKQLLRTFPSRVWSGWVSQLAPPSTKVNRLAASYMSIPPHA